MSTWKLEDAEKAFEELFGLALAGPPRRVAGEGGDAVVVLRAAERERLDATVDLLAFMQSSPLAEANAAGEPDLSRERGAGRAADVPDSRSA